MCLFDEQGAMQAEGKKSFVEGFRSGRTKIILELLQDDILSIDDAAKKLAITTDELEEKLKHQ